MEAPRVADFVPVQNCSTPKTISMPTDWSFAAAYAIPDPLDVKMTPIWFTFPPPTYKIILRQGHTHFRGGAAYPSNRTGAS